METKDNFSQRVYFWVKQIPDGKVATYGQIAALCGNNKMARQVGWALHVNPSPESIACFKVVFASGALTDGFAFGGKDEQSRLLKQSGVCVENGKVDLAKYQWKN